MYLKNLKLANFRNFADLDLSFAHTTLLIGDNAQGKSNLLESIYFLATTKSPRAEKDTELLKQNEDFARAECKIENGDGSPTTLEIGMQRYQNGIEGLEKRVKVNGIGRRVLDYIGHLNVIYFSPEDIYLVIGPPSLRRWHIDLTLAQIDREYKNALTAYHNAIAAKNKLLKRIREGLVKVSELDFWTDQSIQSGKIVTEKRRNFFEGINLTSDPKGFGFLYHENILSAERLEKYLSREIAAAASLIGPHRDDFDFVVLSERSESKDHNNVGRNLAHYGSRGEQRTAVLQLKMAELEFVKSFTGTLPVLILDDVFSELDQNHRHFVASVINGQQTIMSAVEETQVPGEFLETVKLVRIKEGKVIS